LNYTRIFNSFYIISQFISFVNTFSLNSDKKFVGAEKTAPTEIILQLC